MSEHVYLSTACFHELHDACRLRCPFCDVYCSCDCHDGQRPAAAEVEAPLEEVSS